MAESEIPADIKKSAFTAAGAWFYDHYLRNDLATDIERLLLAERERCASIAESNNAWPQEGADIASAIRATPEE